MKANEMIRTHGVEKLRLILEKYPNHTHMTDDARMFIDENSCIDFIKKDLDQTVKFSDLKRLIDAHDLVTSYGGIDKAHEFALSVWRSNKSDPFIVKMKKAIADMESCQ